MYRAIDDFGRSLWKFAEPFLELREGHLGAPGRHFGAPGGHFDGPESQNLDFGCMFNEKWRFGGAQGAPHLRVLSASKGR